MGPGAFTRARAFHVPVGKTDCKEPSNREGQRGAACFLKWQSSQTRPPKRAYDIPLVFLLPVLLAANHLSHFAPAGGRRADFHIDNYSRPTVEPHRHHRICFS